MLRGDGYTVVAVEDGLSALRYMEHQLPAAIVLDLGLPRMSGRDVYRELKSRPETQNIPIVVVTGTDASDLNASDFAALLTKPVQAEELLRAVERAIGRSGIRQGY